MDLKKPNTPSYQNLYSAPQADIIPPHLPSQTQQFYVVSQRKFLILLFSTFSLYSLYWFWKNWSLWRDHTGEKIWPIPRAWFAIFFIHSLFNKIEDNANKLDGYQAPSLGTAATVCVIAEIGLNISARLPLGTIAYMILAIALIVALAWSIWQAQIQVNLAANDNQGQQNSKLTALNYLWIALGSTIWILNIWITMEVYGF
ncbi:hypothetical protein [Psychrobacter sp. I-STPA6b]|uniref:hypothetical protein n=1 Tax=Psychrobacter sp. I-STPA6b TaxID=2585718 RepID=UPI001D0C4BD8|nr:hypothetical protein [Psychrobacter sp. I-STPA6b]